jgi:1-acyl-sn-glycerol-3-phosphate acyltransferase
VKKKQHMPFVYWLCSTIMYIWGKIWFRLSHHGLENIPDEGGCILASNHVSYLDPPLTGCGVRKRPVRYMARDTLMSNRFSRWLLLSLLNIPVNREQGGTAALKKGLQALKEGSALGLFPEGTRSPDGNLQPAKGGIGFLMIKSHVPVIPVYIDGSYKAYPKGAKFIKPAKISVHYGKPIQPEEFAALGEGKEVYQKAGEYVMQKIAELRDNK